MLKRDLYYRIKQYLDKQKILIIKGARQVGKTTLMKNLQQELESLGLATYYLSIDQELENPILKNSRIFAEFLINQYSKYFPDKKLYLFLDEFQYLNDPGIFLKTLFDQTKDNIQIIVSGSSSLEITKTTEFLTGRKLEFYMYPLNYIEFLRYKSNINFPQEKFHLNNFVKIEKFYEIYKEEINKFLMEYLNFGGYPGIVVVDNFEEKKFFLKNLISTYIEKDIIAFLKIENVKGFHSLIKILSSQIGSLVNQFHLSSEIGLSINTFKKYSDILVGTYIFDFISPYFTNIRKELSKMPKVYISDFGMRNVILNSFDNNFVEGSVRENFVFNVLKDIYGIDNIKFYRTLSKSEIDFVLDFGPQLIPIEVKSTKKEISEPIAIRNFTKENSGKVQSKIIVTDDYLAKKENLYFIPTALLPFINLK